MNIRNTSIGFTVLMILLAGTAVPAFAATNPSGTIGATVPVSAGTNSNVNPPGTTGVTVPVSAGSDTSNCGESGSGAIVNPLKGICDLPSLLRAILAGVINLATIAVTIALVWVGFLFVKAQGNPGELKTARSALLWTVIGGLILLASQGILTVIQATANSFSN